MECPSDSELQALVEGAASAVLQAQLREHLDRCDACRRAVAQVARRAPLAPQALSRTHPSNRVDPTEEELPPGPFGRYLLSGTLGRGGMGVVYAAHDTVLGRPVALKIIAKGYSSDAAEERLKREAQAMARLSHPNVVNVYDAGHVEGRVFLSMELVAGVTLAGWLAQRARSWREVVQVMIGAGQGLCAAHRVGLVHRDFKPANVLIDADGRARVADFGLASAMTRIEARLDLSLPLATSVAGTPAYMAPEQLDGAVPTERADQFAFCVTLYEALYGERPFRGVERAVVPPRRGGRGVPRWLDSAIDRGLSLDPEKRFDSMEQLMALLERGASPRVRKRFLLGLGLTLGVGLFAGALATSAWRRAPVPSTLEPTHDAVSVVPPAPEREPERATKKAPPSKPRAPVKAAPAAPVAGSDLPATLKVHVHPWGNIFVDEAPCSTSSTTDCAFTLPAGRHVVKVVNPFVLGAGDWSETITLAGGETMPLKINLTLVVDGG